MPEGPTPVNSRAPAPTHHLPAHEAVLLVQSDGEHGLDPQQAASRLAAFGPNVLPAAPRPGIVRRLLRQLNSPLLYVLIVSGVVSLLLAEPVDASVIFGVVVLSAAVGFVQESRAEASLEALREMVRTTARVVRGGRASIVPSQELVPGDLVLLEAGDKVPADLRLVREHELAADESALTGESLPVEKDEVVLDAATPVADRRNMLWSGTLVTAGSGAGVVVATGAATELGEVHRLVGTAEDLATPLTRKLARFSTVLTGVIVALAVVTFVVGTLRGTPAQDMFMAAVALAVAAIPEGLPAAVTVTLAIGVGRMARRRAVVRRMPAVETLGGTTVICTDKTGTLTQNQMTVRAVWTPSGDYDVSGAGYAPHGAITGSRQAASPPEEDQALATCLLAGAACNDARVVPSGDGWMAVGDPTEAALAVSAAKGGVDASDLAVRRPRSDVIAFSSERKWMATLHPDPGVPHDRADVFVKGAVERLLPLCSGQLLADGSVVPVEADRVLAAADRFGREGLRVLALATMQQREDEALLEETLSGRLVLLGLQAMHDPPRPAAAAAVAACHDAGISVKMITGDHEATAAAVARSVGVLPPRAAPDAVTSGARLAELPAPELAAAAESAAVFARVTPEQKLLLVRALQERGHVVAMTGDGVNDAPALQQADIGIAMGRAGTEVAKDAADLVLMDDDFATIEAAVEEGRGVFDNLTKFLVWTLPTNTGQALVILLAVLTGSVLPVLPVQILWINMTTAVALGLTLAFEPKEDGIMRRPPRDPQQQLIERVLLHRILLVAALLVTATALLFRWEQAVGSSVAEARTSAVNLFVGVSVLYLFACRSMTLPVRRLGVLSNRWVLAGVGLQLAAQAALTYAPVMQALFDTAAISAASWVRVAALSALCAAVVAWHKHLAAGAAVRPAAAPHRSASAPTS